MPRLLILYHYFYPDDVVSAHHFAQLAEELQARGWQVMAMPCNRGCRDESKKFKAVENWNGIEIRRIWRPRFRESSSIGRILNVVWMLFTWSIVALKKKNVPNIDVVVVGTDPILSVLVALAWKMSRPRTRVVQWCFDLHEMVLAERFLRPRFIFVNALKALLKPAYGACDLIVDIGKCMKTKLQEYSKSTAKITLTPWALAEPAGPLPIDVAERESVFGNSKLAILYSGNFGRAHSYDMFLELARHLRGEGIEFAFSIRGNRADEVKKAVSSSDNNVAFVPFAPIEQLQARLSSADIHLVSLRDEWCGYVVPSKFFGSLAVGRPIIFAGDKSSALARWIETYKVGWVLTEETAPFVAERLKQLSQSREQLKSLWQRCHQVYQNSFSKKEIADQWNYELCKLLEKA